MGGEGRQLTKVTGTVNFGNHSSAGKSGLPTENLFCAPRLRLRASLRQSGMGSFRLATGWSGCVATARANTASAFTSSTAFVLSGARATHSASRSRIITEEITYAPAEKKYDCGPSRRNSAHGVHGTHGNHRLSTGQVAAPSRRLRDRARQAGDQRRRRAAPGQVLWDDAAILDESSDGLPSANGSHHRPTE